MKTTKHHFEDTTMNIGIIVYSYTGNTLYAANQLKDVLENQGHHVTLSQVKAENEDPKLLDSPLIQRPDPLPYDRVIFACPVRGFQVAPIMKTYLEDLPDLKKKPVGIFVTHAFPFAWMGGKTAISMMKGLLVGRSANIKPSAIVNGGKKAADIQQMIGLLTNESVWK